jgi:hypothetical protein
LLVGGEFWFGDAGGVDVEAHGAGGEVLEEDLLRAEAGGEEMAGVD